VDSKSASYRTIDEYIATFPADIQSLLAAVRATIRAAAPDAQERISYLMPTFAQQGNLVHFAAMKGYIGFYPTSSGVESFQTELAPYASTKGAVHFPFDQPLPLDLIRRITEYRVGENLKRAAARANSGQTGSARP
jgi:uncharacterized protein YdhG (YjbR/CyaY superfamily)